MAAHGDLITDAAVAPAAAAAGGDGEGRSKKRPEVHTMVLGDIVAGGKYAVGLRTYVPGRGGVKALKPEDQSSAKLYVVSAEAKADGTIDTKYGRNFSVVAGVVQPRTMDDVCVFRTPATVSKDAVGYGSLNKWAVLRMPPAFARQLKELEALVFGYALQNKMLFFNGAVLEMDDDTYEFQRAKFVKAGGQAEDFGLMEYLQRMNIATSCVAPMQRNKEPVEGEFSAIASFRLWSSDVQESGPNAGQPRNPLPRTKMVPVNRVAVPATVPIGDSITQPGEGGQVWVHGVVQEDAQQVMDVEALTPSAELSFPSPDVELDFEEAVRTCHLPAGTTACIEFHVEQLKFVHGKYKLGLRAKTVRVMHPEHPINALAAENFGSDAAGDDVSKDAADAIGGVDIAALLAASAAAAAAAPAAAAGVPAAAVPVGGAKRPREDEEDEGDSGMEESPKRPRGDSADTADDEGSVE